MNLCILNETIDGLVGIIIHTPQDETKFDRFILSIG